MSERTIVIAEAGVNHNGDPAQALKLVDAAADVGADIVKFQTFHAVALASATASTESPLTLSCVSTDSKTCREPRRKRSPASRRAGAPESARRSP